MLLTALFSVAMYAQSQTLRVDYIFSGTDKSTEISLERLYSFDGWAGRTVNLDKVPVKGNGQISMTDLATGKVIYMQSFSTLFQEWKTTEEATKLRKAMLFFSLTTQIRSITLQSTIFRWRRQEFPGRQKNLN